MNPHAWIRCAALASSTCATRPPAATHVRPAAPVAAAAPAPRGDDSVAIRALAPGFWLHTSTRAFGAARTLTPSNGLIVALADGALLVDTAWTDEQTRRVLAWAARNLAHPVRRALVTHAHDDRVGGFELYYPGPGHAPDNVVVYFPAARVLFGGCLIKSSDARGLGFTGDADLGAWPTAVERVARRFPDATTVVPEHGAPGGRELLDHTLELPRAQ